MPWATPKRLLKASTRAPASSFHRLAQIETGQAGGVDLQHGHLQPRIGAQQLGLELPAVGQHGRDVVGVEHVAVGGEDVALGRNEDAALIVLQAVESAGAIDFDDLRLHLVDRLDDRGRGGGTKECDEEEQRNRRTLSATTESGRERGHGVGHRVYRDYSALTLARLPEGEGAFGTFSPERRRACNLRSARNHAYFSDSRPCRHLERGKQLVAIADLDPAGPDIGRPPRDSRKNRFRKGRLLVGKHFQRQQVSLGRVEVETAFHVPVREPTSTSTSPSCPASGAVP